MEHGTASTPKAAEPLDTLTRALARAIQIYPRLLRPSDLIGDLIAIDVTKLSDEDREVLGRYGTTERLDVFGAELIDELRQMLPPDAWDDIRVKLNPATNAEHDWLGSLECLTVREAAVLFET
jgi:hypothetical protein